jgi:hypothetical protein
MEAAPVAEVGPVPSGVAMGAVPAAGVGPSGAATGAGPTAEVTPSWVVPAAGGGHGGRADNRGHAVEGSEVLNFNVHFLNVGQ